MGQNACVELRWMGKIDKISGRRSDPVRDGPFLVGDKTTPPTFTINGKQAYGHSSLLSKQRERTYYRSFVVRPQDLIASSHLSDSDSRCRGKARQQSGRACRCFKIYTHDQRANDVRIHGDQQMRISLHILPSTWARLSLINAF